MEFSLIVPNASGKPRFRLVLDLRKLNEITVGKFFPLPNITDILEQVGKSTYFTILDLANGYWQLEIKEENKAKTAFTAADGHWEFNRMVFALNGAPST